MTQFFYRNGAPVSTDTKISLKKETSNTGTVLEHFACTRCGGEGGNHVWNHTGYTCYRCGGKTRILPYLAFYDNKAVAPSATVKIWKPTKKVADYHELNID